MPCLECWQFRLSPSTTGLSPLSFQNVGVERFLMHKGHHHTPFRYGFRSHPVLARGAWHRLASCIDLQRRIGRDPSHKWICSGIRSWGQMIIAYKPKNVLKVLFSESMPSERVLFRMVPIGMFASGIHLEASRKKASEPACL